MQRPLIRRAIFTLCLALIGFEANSIMVQAAFPVFSMSLTSGTPGTSIAVNGTGFGRNETGITLTYDRISITTNITANSQGNWSTTLVIPASVTGPHSIGTYGSMTPAANVPVKTFTVAPGITLNPVSGSPGTTVTVTGVGFTAGEKEITVSYDDNPVVIDVTADAKGGWTTKLVIPLSISDSHTIDAYSPTTQAVSVPDKIFTVLPSLTLSPTSAVPGSPLTVTGAGFGSGEMDIRVTCDGTAIASGVVSDFQGNWSVNTIVPALASGSHIFDASSSLIPADKVPDKTLTASPVITLDTRTGIVGSTLNITGEGFGANETGIKVTYDGASTVSGIIADALGSWSAALVIPASASGPHAIDASGAVSAASKVTDRSFLVIPAIELNLKDGIPGSSVTISGTGFGASEKGIVIYYDDGLIGPQVAADAKGNYKVTIAITASISGTHKVGAYGSVTLTTTVEQKDFNVIPVITVNPNSGNIGASVVITGAGFAPGSLLQIIFDDQQVYTEGITTDSSGSFNKSFTVPRAPNGERNIKVIDWQNNVAATVFNIEQNPPPKPNLLSPGEDVRLGIRGNVSPTLRWSDVSDPSGVTFILQIDSSSDFSQPVLEKSNLSGTSYTLTSAEALPRGRYYWRVKTIDGAGNESNWSLYRSFKSGETEPAAPLTIASLALILLVIGLYTLMRYVRKMGSHAFKCTPVI